MNFFSDLKSRLGHQSYLIDLLAYTLILITVYFVYVPSITPQYFVFDDLHHEERVQQLMDLGFWKLFFSKETGIPVFFGTLILFYQFFEDEFIITNLKALNLILHYINAVVLYQVSIIFVTKIKPEVQENLSLIRFSCLFLAILFVVHPIQVESVVWVSSMKGTMALTFILLACWLKLQPLASHSSIRLLQSVSILILFTLSLWSKPILITLPLLFAFYDWQVKKIQWRQALLKNSYLLIAALPIAYFHIWTFTPWIIQLFFQRLINPFPQLQWGWMIPPMALILLGGLGYFAYKKIPLRLLAMAFLAAIGMTYFPQTMALLEKLNGSIVVFVFTFYKIIFPSQLGFDYGINPEFLNLNYGWIKQLLTVAITAALLWFFRKRKITIGLFLLFLVALPYLGFFMYEFAYISFFADRFAYPVLAMLGLLLAYPLYRLFLRYKLATLALFIALSALCIDKTSKQIEYWASSEAFLKHSLQINPNSLASRLAMASLFELNGLPEISLRYHNEALALSSKNPETYLSLLYLLFRMERYEEIIKTFELIGVLTSSIDKEVFPILARTYALLGNIDQAEFYTRLSLLYIPWHQSSQDMLKFIEGLREAMNAANEK